MIETIQCSLVLVLKYHAYFMANWQQFMFYNVIDVICSGSVCNAGTLVDAVSFARSNK